MCWCVKTTTPLISRPCLMSMQIIWLYEVSANYSVQIGIVLLYLSLGMMTKRMGRRRHSDRTTSPCCPTSVHQLEVTPKTRPTRLTASSLRGGWRASTHSKNNTVEDVHIHAGNHKLFVRFSCNAQTVESLAQMWTDFDETSQTWCLHHQCRFKMKIYLYLSCLYMFFFIHKSTV